MVERLFPAERPGCITPRENEMTFADLIPEGFAEQARPVNGETAGYLQVIDHDGLLDLAIEHDLVLRVLHRVGHFLVPNSALVEVWPGEAVDDAELCKRINGLFITGRQRTRNTEQRDALLRQAAIIEQSSQKSLAVTDDRERVHASYLEIYEKLEKHFGLTGEVR